MGVAIKLGGLGNPIFSRTLPALGHLTASPFHRRTTPVIKRFPYVDLKLPSCDILLLVLTGNEMSLFYFNNAATLLY